MDAFYASVEQRDRPELRGRPVIVGGASGRAAWSPRRRYEARRFGVRSAMPTLRGPRALSRRRSSCRGDMAKYRRVSAQIRAVFERVSPAGRAALARRGLHRRRPASVRAARPAAGDRPAGEGRRARGDRARGVGRHRARQDGGEDRERPVQARRPARGAGRTTCARSSRRCRSAGSGASGPVTEARLGTPRASSPIGDLADADPAALAAARRRARPRRCSARARRGRPRGRAPIATPSRTARRTPSPPTYRRSHRTRRDHRARRGGRAPTAPRRRARRARWCSRSSSRSGWVPASIALSRARRRSRRPPTTAPPSAPRRWACGSVTARAVPCGCSASRRRASWGRRTPSWRCSTTRRA